MDETESRLVMSISHEYEFNKLLSKRKVIYKENIFYYKNYRCIVRDNKFKYENKIEKQTNRVLKYIDSKFFPLTRRYCIEETLNPCEIQGLPTSVVARYVIYNENNIRISFEHQCNDSSTTFSVVSEIEYTYDVFTKWNKIIKEENLLIDVITSIFENDLSIFNPWKFYDSISIDTITQIKPKKFQTFQIDQKVYQDYSIVLKIDGYKGRMYYDYKDEKLVVYTDLDEIFIYEKNIPPCFEIFKNIFMQIEIMDDKIIITDLLCCSMAKKYY